MRFLLLTILLNVLLVAEFRYFPRIGINALQAIVTNYWVCVITGCLFLGSLPVVDPSAVWLPVAAAIGLGFIVVFNIMAFCTRVDGITVTTVANKLSLVIPVSMAVIVWHEPLGWLKLVGLALSVPAIGLAAGWGSAPGKRASQLLPIALFVGSGLLDALVNMAQKQWLSSQALQAVFAICAFGAAAVLGTLYLAVRIATGKEALSGKSLLAGIGLGIPNYFSIYCYIHALHSGFLSSSAAIPVCNIGTLVVSALVGMFLFREPPVLKKLLGIALAIGAMLLIAVS